MSIGKSVTYQDGNYREFDENVAGALDGKEGYVVETLSDGTIQLFSAGANFANGVVFNKIKKGATQVNVRLLGKNGTVKMVASGAIATGGRVTPVATGTVVAAQAGDRTIGIKVGPPGTCASG